MHVCMVCTQRLIGDQVMITMRKDYCLPEKVSRRKRRQLDCDLKIPCSLEDLPPPSKLRKRVLLGASVSGRNKSYMNKKSTGLDITTHIAMLKRKHSAMSRSETLQSSPNRDKMIQEVPTSPTFSELNPSLHHSFNDINRDCNENVQVSTRKLVKPVWELSSDSVCNHSDTPLGDTTGDASEEIDEQHYEDDISINIPITGFLSESFTDFAKLHVDDSGHSLELEPEPDRQAMFSEQVLTNNGLPFSIPSSSPPSPHPRFNSRTFGIQRFLPREE